MAVRLLIFIVLLCGGLALIELWIPLFTSSARARGRNQANLSLTLVTFALNWALDSAAAILALALSVEGNGVLRPFALSLGVTITITIVVLDLSAYLAHWAMHKSPLLWRIHRVHHSDPFVDVTTAFRQHPFEGVWRFFWTIAPIWLLGLPAAGVIVYRALSAGNALLEHANIRFAQRVDRALARAWVSPNMHKVHHSKEQPQTDSNYGNILSIFDHVFRTFRPTGEAVGVTYGLEGMSPEEGKSLARLVRLPFA
jgi:sterol desaturase/sphingolipid hydroxylase (fatty acid hydroxylase superfamily)